MIRVVALSSVGLLLVVSCAGGPIMEATIQAAFLRSEKAATTESSSRLYKIWNNSRRKKRRRFRNLEDYNNYNGDDYYEVQDDDAAAAAANDDDSSSQKNTGNIADERCSEFLVSFLEGTTDAHDTCEGIMNAYTAAGAFGVTRDSSGTECSKQNSNFTSTRFNDRLFFFLWRIN